MTITNVETLSRLAATTVASYGDLVNARMGPGYLNS